jgi:sulfatase modifying factor 1
MTLRRSRRQSFQACLKLSIMAVVAAIAIQTRASEDSTPGLVKDKPASGRFVKTDQGYMVLYESTIPGSDVTFTMVPISRGTFMLGSPASEKGRNDDEGPQVEVIVEPFWMSQTETTWAEYTGYMALHDVFKAFQAKGIRKVTKENQADAITAPSNLYDPTFTYGSGDDPQQPAVTMSQYAAKQYTKWLSAVTDQFYRLPSEAEWEYACRAGTKTTYYFGDDDSKLGEHAWYYDNSDDRAHKVAQKKANPWGLYDMHGNVAEWTLDQHVAEHYRRRAGKSVKALDIISWPTQLEDRVVRGGSLEIETQYLRAASRNATSDEDLKD